MRAVSGMALACLVTLTAPAAAASDDDDGEPQAKVSKQACRLDKTHKGTVLTTVNP